MDSRSMSSLYLQVCVLDLSKTDFTVSLISQHFFAWSVHLISQKWNLSLIPVFPLYLTSNPQKILVLLEKHAPESTHFSCPDQRCFLLQDPHCGRGWKGERDAETFILRSPCCQRCPWELEAKPKGAGPKVGHLSILPVYLLHSIFFFFLVLFSLFSLSNFPIFSNRFKLAPTFTLSFSLFLAIL